MKFKTSFQAIKKSYLHRIEIPYCGASYLLTGLSPAAYTAGVYGWNADIYIINHDTVIITGYRPQCCTAKPPYQLLKEYEKRAEKIYRRRSWKYDTKLKYIENLRNELINQLTV